MSVPALSAGPVRRTSTVFVATAFAAAAAASLMGGMLALWLDFRAKAPTRIASDGAVSYTHLTLPTNREV